MSFGSCFQSETKSRARGDQKGSVGALAAVCHGGGMPPGQFGIADTDGELGTGVTGRKGDPIGYTVNLQPFEAHANYAATSTSFARAGVLGA